MLLTRVRIGLLITVLIGSALGLTVLWDRATASHIVGGTDVRVELAAVLDGSPDTLRYLAEWNEFNARSSLGGLRDAAQYRKAWQGISQEIFINDTDPPSVTVYIRWTRDLSRLGFRDDLRFQESVILDIDGNYHLFHIRRENNLWIAEPDGAGNEDHHGNF